MSESGYNIPIGTQTLILSKLYYGIISKKLEKLDIERYFSVLHFIQNNNGCCCQQEVCNTLHIDKTAMVKILDSLTKAGLIERKTNPEDRRQHYLTLSKKGEKQTKEITKTFEALDEEMFAGFSEKEREIFKNVLDRLTEKLQDIPKNNLFFNYKKTKQK